MEASDQVEALNRLKGFKVDTDLSRKLILGMFENHMSGDEEEKQKKDLFANNFNVTQDLLGIQASYRIVDENSVSGRCNFMDNQT